MAIEVFMPALSPTMEKGTLAKWLVKEGDAIKPGDAIAEIETDKATMEVECIEEGIAGKILVPEGTEDVKVGTPIMIVIGEGESLPGKDAPVAAAPSKPEPAASAAPPPPVQPAVAPAAAVMPVAPTVPADGDRLAASPLARRMAAQMGLDLAKIQGFGPNGRIVKADVERAAGMTAASAQPQVIQPQVIQPQVIQPQVIQALQPAAVAPATAPAPAPSVPAGIPSHEVKLSGMRKVIAARLAESKQTVPHFYLTIDCTLDNLLKMRAELNAKLEKSGVKLSVNDFVIRAVALALRKEPDANVMFAGDKMIHFERADISVAVAVDGGLVTPVIRGADARGLAEISSEMTALAKKAREGKLMPEDYQGGTFSISNLGMFGIKQFDAVINPPQAGILAVGTGEQRPVVKDGALAIATVMTCTLSCDHRAIDGAVGARFLAAFKGLIEDPVTMLL